MHRMIQFLPGPLLQTKRSWRGNLTRLALLINALIIGCVASSSDPNAKSGLTSMPDAREPVPSEGRWVGVARVRSAQKGQASRNLAAQLDLIRVGVSGGKQPLYRGILKLAAGGLGGSEYSGLYFREVVWTGQKFIFGKGPDQVALTSKPGGWPMIRADLRAQVDAASVDMELRWQASGTDDQQLDQQLARPITGNYLGTCPDQVVSLQVEASRWRGPGDGDLGLFGGYRLTARVGQADQNTCGRGQTCIKESYARAQYNVLTGVLRLDGPDGVNTCRALGDQLQCRRCTFIREESVPHAVIGASRPVKTFKRQQHLPVLKSAQNRGNDTEDAATQPLVGQFYGYLHHEARNAYQLVALKIGSLPMDAAANDGAHHEPLMAGVATLYFGEGDASEFIAYRLPTVVTGAASGSMVMDGEGEAFLVLERRGDSRIVGSWYSKSYGRVGSLELQQNQVPKLAPHLETVDAIAGHYRADGWEFDVMASAAEAEDPADFYPLKVFGWARENLPSARRHGIEAGVYDFYTGTVALRLDDQRVAVGKVTSGGMQLFWPPVPRFASPMTSNRTRLFRRDEAPRGKEAMVLPR